MRKGNNFIVIFIIIILFLSSFLFNQSYNIHTYTLRNGLPSGMIFSLTQDVSGRMWFASNIGVLEFDNQLWKLHDTFATNKNNAELKWIISNSKSFIYIFYEDLENGGYYYDNKKWNKINGISNKKDVQITGTALIERKGEATIGFGTYKNGLYLHHLGKWRYITDKEGLLDNDIISIDSFKDTFFVLTPKGISIVSNELIDNSLNDILPNKGVGLTGIRVVKNENSAIIWIAGSDWIGKIINGQFIKIKDLNFKINKEFGDLLGYRKTLIEYDKRGIVFFGNINSLYFLNLQNKSIKKLDSNNGITSGGITSLLQDRELNIWSGTKIGVNKIISLQFENYNRNNGLLEDEVTSVTEIIPEIMVFGHNNGFTIKRGEIYQKVKLDKFLKKKTNTRIFELFLDSSKRLWLSAGSGGLFLFDTSLNFNLINHWECDPGYEITSIIEDNLKRIWVAGKSGIWIIKNNILVPIKPDGLPIPYVRKMFLLNNNELYFTTISNGIYRFKDNKWENFFSKKINKYNSTYAVIKYKNNSLLVGSKDGLLKLKNGKLNLFSDLGWNINRPVYFIINDKQNNYWVGTNRGVVRFNDLSFKNYTYIDGLTGVETNRGAGFVDSAGGVWIGMDQGVSKFIYDLKDIPYPRPLINLIKIVANNIEYKPETKIKLNINSSLEFYFKGISFIDSSPLKYKYKLIGYDKDWKKKTIRDGYVRYNNLSTGNYTFAIKAINGKGVESNLYSVKNIEIRTPFYIKYWFLLISFFIGLIFIFLFKKYFKQIKVSNLLKNEIYKKDIQLKESLLSYQSLFEESLDCIFTSTPDGMFLSINKAGLDMFGYKSLKEISRKNIEKDLYVDKNRREEFKRLMKENGFVKNFESKSKRKDGSTLVVLESSYLIKNNKGEIIGYRGILRDITDQLKLQTQLIQAQKMESIGLLAGGIAHDFNNILSGILGYANLLKRTLIEDKKSYKYISTIERSAERAAELTSKLLGFARKGKFKVDLIDINDVIIDVTNLLRPIIDKTIKIEHKLEQSGGMIEADVSQIQQIIMNICLNARDALPNGGVISLSSKHCSLSDLDQRSFFLTAKPGKFIKVSIKDNGFGIRKEYISKIFDPFFTTKKGSKGSGLGLSMVYGVLKNHFGALNLSSVDGEGTDFELYFPIIKMDKKQKKKIDSEKSDSSEMAEILQGTETILIIDDDEIHRELLISILKENGYSYVAATNGIDGINKYLKNRDKISLIILDMSMPKMGGRETFLKLKKISPEIKVLINSGYSLDHKVGQILKYKNTDFLQKPFKPRVLLIKLKAMLENK